MTASNITRNFTSFYNYNCGEFQDPLFYFKETIMVLTIVAIIIAIFGNIFILIVVYRNPPMHTFTNILIFSCALSDLLRTQTGIFRIINDFKPNQRFVTLLLSMFMCKLNFFCLFASLAATNVGLSFIAMDRYFLVMRPKSKVFTKRTLFFVLPIIWITAFAFASPAVFSQQIVYYPGLGKKCVEKWPDVFDQIESPKRFTVILFVFLYVLPLLLMTVLYSSIGRKLLIMIKNRQCSIDVDTPPPPPAKLTFAVVKYRPKFIRQDTNGAIQEEISISNMTRLLSSIRANPANSQKLRVIKMLIIIVIGFAVSWIPIFALQFVLLFHSPIIQCPNTLPHWVPEFARFMHYLNSAMNPLLYFGYSSTFRKGIKDLFASVIPCIKKLSS